MALWKEDLVIVNKFSRPAFKLLTVKGIVMHWTANAGAGDESHQKFFDGSDGGGGRYAGAHLFIDKDSATLIIPLNEVAYHANDRACKINKLKATASFYKGGNANLNTIGIEMCVEKDGTIHPDTVKRSVDVVAELCKKFKLDSEDIYRHYDVTGKNCPAPWVSDVSKFTNFKKDVKAKMTAKVVKPVETKKPVTSNANQHVVVAGDTLWAIANKYGVTVDAIQKLNNLKTTALEIGQVLKLKETTTTPAKATPAKEVAKPKKKYIKLPKTSDSWRVYPLDKAPKAGNEKGYLNPKKFGGLEYEVLGNPQTDVYTIKTGNFGKVNVYGAKSTGATIVTK